MSVKEQVRHYSQAFWPLFDPSSSKSKMPGISTLASLYNSDTFVSTIILYLNDNAVKLMKVIHFPDFFREIMERFKHFIKSMKRTKRSRESKKKMKIASIFVPRRATTKDEEKKSWTKKGNLFEILDAQLLQSFVFLSTNNRNWLKFRTAILNEKIRSGFTIKFVLHANFFMHGRDVANLGRYYKSGL